MLLRLKDDVLSLDPAAVVMLMGTNDLEEQATAGEIAGNVKLIVAALKAHNAQLPIVLCNVMPSSADKKRPADKIQEINKQVFEVVKGDPQITVVDTWTLFAGEGGDAKKEEFPDCCIPMTRAMQSGPPHCGRSWPRLASWKPSPIHSSSNQALKACSTVKI